MNVRTSWLRRVGLTAVGALATTAPVLLADQVGGPSGTIDDARAVARAWADVLPGQDSPLLPEPGGLESAIVVLASPPLAHVAADDRSAAARAIDAEQAEFVAALASIGGEVTFSYRALLNGVGVRVPAGRLPQVADLPGVATVHPVTFLAPAQEQAGAPTPLPAATAAAPTPQTGVDPSPAPPLTVALIDAGVHAEHPALGGGIGPDRLIIGGEDLVHGASTPSAPAERRVEEAHGTQMAGLVLRSPSLAALPAERLPRMRAYRVVASETVAGRERELARSDRVLAAMDRAVDPDGDGDLSDHASVILLGVARAGVGGQGDPLAQAAVAADAAGVLVVAPTGNGGPGASPGLGSVGSPASSPAVLSVGGLTADSRPRTADIVLSDTSGDTRLRDVPLMGPEPIDGARPVVFLDGPDGISPGTDVADYTDPGGQSRVAGAIVVVARGGGSLQRVARAAAQAGAAAVAVWDRDGSGVFPGIRADREFDIPVIGLGRAQGEILARVRSRVVVRPAAAGPAEPTVAAFSSRGPAVDGGAAPAVVAPAVDVEAPYPGVGDENLVTRMSGTSAAAAQVAALALRIREDRPWLTPADVRSLIVQSARAVAGSDAGAQGGGAVRDALDLSVAISPAVVGVRRVPGSGTSVRVELHELAGTPRQVRLGVTDRYGTTVVPPGEPVDLTAAGRFDAVVEIPPLAGDLNGFVIVVAPDGSRLAAAPLVVAAPPAATVRMAAPRVETDSGRVTVRMTLAGTAPAVVDRLRMLLVPEDGGGAFVLIDPRIRSEWPVGEYGFVLSGRGVDGASIPGGRYRVRIGATGPAGERLEAASAAFTIAP